MPLTCTTSCASSRLSDSSLARSGGHHFCSRNAALKAISWTLDGVHDLTRQSCGQDLTRQSCTPGEWWRGKSCWLRDGPVSGQDLTRQSCVQDLTTMQSCTPDEWRPGKGCWLRDGRESGQAGRLYIPG